MSELVVTVFKLLGRQPPRNPGYGKGQYRFDLLIQPMMVREGSDAAQDSSLQVRLAKESPAQT